MTGPEALEAWEQAMRFVRDGRYDDARKVKLLKSDYRALEEMIQKLEAKPNANRMKFKGETK